MNWYEKLYIGKTVKKGREALIRSVEKGSRFSGLWVLMLPLQETNQLEIVPAWNLKFWLRKTESAWIVGIAGSKEEAVTLVEEIVQDVLRETGGAGLRAWFLAQRETLFCSFAAGSED